MTTISRNAFTANRLFSQDPATQAQQAQTAQQIAATLLMGLDAQAPQLATQARAMLALSGMNLPGTQFQGGNNPFSAFSVMDPRAAMAGVGAFRDPLPANNYFSPAEIQQNLDATFGLGAASLAQRADQTMSLSQMGLMAALGGASREQLVDLLGKDNPYSAGLARRIETLAGELMRAPPDAARLQHAAQRADWAMLHHATPGDAGGRGQLKQLFQQEYGVARPGAQPYVGAGAFGNQVETVAGAAAVPPPSGTGAGARALSLAQSQVGVREATGNNDGIPAQRYSNGRREPWCANFVAWSFRESGNPLPGNQRSLASVQYMEDQMKANGKWFARGAGTPQPGDVIFFANRGDSDRGPGRHVGIVERVENGRVYTVEGNSSNQVARRSYPLDHARISGYGRN